MLILFVFYKPSRGSLRTLALNGYSSLSVQDFIFKVYVELRCVKSKRKVETKLKKIKDTLYDLSELFKVFGDSTRIKILYDLFSGEKNVTEICQDLEMNQSAVSHQLKILRTTKLVQGRREGKSIVYALADDHVKTIIAMGIEHIEE